MDKKKRGRPKSAPINTEIGKRIKTARMSASLSQQELADKINVSVDTVRGWENSRHLPEKEGIFELIAEVCGVSVSWLRCADAPTIVLETAAMLKSVTWQELPQTTLDEEARSYALIYSLQMCGYSIEDISNKKRYSEYMESSIRNSIEFYMNNLNEKQKGKSP